MKRIGVLGAGTWGTAPAIMPAQTGNGGVSPLDAVNNLMTRDKRNEIDK